MQLSHKFLQRRRLFRFLGGFIFTRPHNPLVKKSKGNNFRSPCFLFLPRSGLVVPFPTTNSSCVKRLQQAIIGISAASAAIAAMVTALTWWHLARHFLFLPYSARSTRKVVLHRRAVFSGRFGATESDRIQENTVCSHRMWSHVPTDGDRHNTCTRTYVDCCKVPRRAAATRESHKSDLARDR